MDLTASVAKEPARLVATRSLNENGPPPMFEGVIQTFSTETNAL
jgi:hypothetical protein